MITFTVHGLPQPAGSKKAMPIYRKSATGKTLATRANGSPMIAVVDANPNSREWKNLVSDAARQAYGGEPLTGPLNVHLHFFRPRPKGHYNSKGELNKTGRLAEFPTTKPDVLKLARAVEDALTGIVWVDDSQIVNEQIAKGWAVNPHVFVRVWRA